MRSFTPDFENTEIAFASRSDKELQNAVRLFVLINNAWLVNMGKRLLGFALKAGLPVAGLFRNTMFAQFCGGETLDTCDTVLQKLFSKNIAGILAFAAESHESEAELDASLEEILRLIKKSKKNPLLPLTELKPTSVIPPSLLEKKSKGDSLNAEELIRWQNGLARMEKICLQSQECDVPVMIDAEESWIQQALDQMVEHLMEKYNKEKALVYNTLQMYRTDRLDYLANVLRRAEEKNYFIGIKLVRGAYVEKENEYARAHNVTSVIHTNKQAVDHGFDLALRFCVEHIDRIALCAGTHNEKSCLLLASLIEQKNIDKKDARIYFSQLYGMSDHISFNLAHHGYNVAKYIPYGPVQKVVPYLIRRAEENTAIAGQMGRELALLMKEKRRRTKKERGF